MLLNEERSILMGVNCTNQPLFSIFKVALRTRECKESSFIHVMALKMRNDSPFLCRHNSSFKLFIFSSRWPNYQQNYNFGCYFHHEFSPLNLKIAYIHLNPQQLIKLILNNLCFV